MPAPEGRVSRRSPTTSSRRRERPVEVAAVGIVAPVVVRVEERAQQVPVRGVQLDPVEPRGDDPGRRVDEPRPDLGDLGEGHCARPAEGAGDRDCRAVGGGDGPGLDDAVGLPTRDARAGRR